MFGIPASDGIGLFSTVRKRSQIQLRAAHAHPDSEFCDRSSVPKLSSPTSEGIVPSVKRQIKQGDAFRMIPDSRFCDRSIERS